MDSVDARIGSTSYVSGSIEGEGNLIVEGRVDGTITIKGDLEIAAHAQVKSSVQARSIYVMGILVGDAIAADRVELAPTARMVGDVRAPRFLIQDGAAFRGRVDMVDFPTSERQVELGRAARASTRPLGIVATRSSAPPSRRAVTPEPRRDSPMLRSSAPSSARASVAPASPQESAPSPAAPAAGARGGANLYTPPPLPRPPEHLGARKAIIIKKKTSDGS